jgi:hypothetical protein
MSDTDRKALELERLIAGGGDGGDEARALAAVALQVSESLSPAAADEGPSHRVWRRLLLDLQRPQRHPSPRPLRILRPAYVFAAVVLAILMSLGSTAAFASESALPGDALYPMKRGLETARLALASAAGHDELAVSFADRRLSEIEALAAKGRWNDLAGALATYPSVIDGLDALDPTVVDVHLERHLEVLEGVLTRAPEAAKPGLTRAIERAGMELPVRQGGEGTGETPTEGPEEHGRGRSGKTPGPDRVPPGLEKKLTPTP